MCHYKLFEGMTLLAAGAAALVWLLQLLSAVAADTQAQMRMGLPNCTTSCGDVMVPYPFGIEPRCYLLGFSLICNTSYTPPRLYPWNWMFDVYGLDIKNISLDDSTVRFETKPLDNITYPGPCLYEIQLVVEWKLGSSALQGPNETRAGNTTCPQDLGSTTCHSSHATCHATTRSSHAINQSYISGYICKCDDGLIVGLGVGSGAMLFFLVLSATFIIRSIQTQRKRNMRQRFFKQNRGQLLQQLVCQRADIGERMIISLEELEKATNGFDKAREIGGGGHGTIYKGILSSLHVVAIKKSKIVIQKEIDEFINEVAILSQINHKNIVKLLGCCLETEVPLLVYEFISNGTLQNHLHVEASISLPWKDRLRIAVEIAKALAYLHSLVSMPIIHRDVKSPNILLDDNLTVKLSDFGASRYIPIDQSGLDTTVQGTFGYLDPMYQSTGHLTEKSDVYSFGVILIELLTRKKPVSYRSPHGHGLVYNFVTLLAEGKLDHILDPQVHKEGGGEVVDIALLAAICVKFVSKDRPTMRQVEMTLESIYAAKEYSSSDIITEESETFLRMTCLLEGKAWPEAANQD